MQHYLIIEGNKVG